MSATDRPALSVSLPYWQDRDPLDALAVAAAAERLGFDRLWVGEMATFDAFALATAIGLAPGRMPLCIGPLAVDVRTPATIAMGVASVAALTGRAVDVAIGSSSTVVVRGWHGRERRGTAAHLAESAQILRGLLTGKKVDFAGTVERTSGYRLRLAAPSSSITVAAFGPRALAAAARSADRVVLNLVTPEQVSRCAESVRAAARRAGLPDPALSVWVTAAADPSADILATVRRGVVGYLRAPGYDAMFAEAGFGDLVRLAHAGAHPRDVFAAVPDELPAAVGIFGDETALRHRVAAYRAAGADEVVIVPATSAADLAAQHTLATLARIHHA
ncbi:LLM class F420-dependent oxidoreductase [Nocardia brasiliensis]|uniref:LLM class F420-dependent oxidoreductase n=1 Tax=Nocardia brasiliensis TaxID=37326 RepID=UPI0005AB5EF5|nr:LLM class F420-dependent oxidoreductase [Nocardia brasiliensis]ASF12982.1 LLM class F420-dependent oxidoreductase [Nocardia brasiliensis]SUB41005.1 methylenetetrahydromethanopterin reductase [Nocardia brasiliensis]